MSKFVIEGPCKLKGSIKISGAKNAALKILPASILAKTASTISNVPNIADIEKMVSILESIGARVNFNADVITIDPTSIHSSKPDEKLIKQLRGSIVIVGPLLAKFGEAIFSQPGGCLIGARPIDDHLDVFAQLGIKITKKGNNYHLKGKPKAGEITLNAMSVTATENAIMASVFSPGKTIIHIAAAEPEIVDLANYLNNMGAKITGAGTHDITIEGVKELNGTLHHVLPDRIEAGTYLMAAVATNSRVKIGPLVSDHLNLVLKRLKLAGAPFEIINESGKEFILTKEHGQLTSQNIDTRPYPGFPTDLQSPYAVLMTQAKGECQIFETIFEGRFLYLDELNIMGANFEIFNPQRIQINGPVKLKGREIVSRDIRGGAALVIAGLLANGTTIIDGLNYIDRGYEQIDEKLRNAGAKISRIE